LKQFTVKQEINKVNNQSQAKREYPKHLGQCTWLGWPWLGKALGNSPRIVPRENPWEKVIKMPETIYCKRCK